MTLQEKYEWLMPLTGDEMLTAIGKLTEVEHEYINARIILNQLKAGELMIELPEEEKNKRIKIWTDKVEEFESKQHLAAG